jgi:acyl-CoA dehydrogenase
MDVTRTPLRYFAATVRASAIAGLARRVLDMSANYTRTRQQFGKPICEFQAIQQQLAVLAEECAAASMAANIGCGATGLHPTLLAAAIAKMRASSAAEQIRSISHALHGAIGFSEEYDLQLLTRRLAEERMADGSESYWAQMIGEARLTSSAPTSISFVRTALGAA